MLAKRLFCCVLVALWVMAQSVASFAHFSDASGHSHNSPSITSLAPESASQQRSENLHDSSLHEMSTAAQAPGMMQEDRQHHHTTADSCCDVTCSVGQALIDCADMSVALSGKTSIEPADVLLGELVGLQTPPPNATA